MGAETEPEFTANDFVSTCRWAVDDDFLRPFAIVSCLTRLPDDKATQWLDDKTLTRWQPGQCLPVTVNAAQSPTHQR